MTMRIRDYVLLGLCAVWLVLAVRSYIKKKKSGGCFGCDGCGGGDCGGCGRQRKPR